LGTKGTYHVRVLVDTDFIALVVVSILVKLVNEFGVFDEALECFVDVVIGFSGFFLVHFEELVEFGP